jgi:tRNA-dihydrouridine synthase B
MYATPDIAAHARELRLGDRRIRTPLVLAPMEDVTSAPFRALCRRHGADLVFTEFVSAEGLVRDNRKSTEKLRLLDEERPAGVQIFGERPAAMADAARRAVDEAAPDVIDINIGCPVRKVVKKGAGAALLKDLELTERIVRGIVRAVDVPVTAKARIGWDAESIRIIELVRMLEANGVAAVSIHARTRAQGYDERADWRWIAAARRAVTIPVIGNGDVASPRDAARLLEETGCDGVMIGRAAIGNPWIFRRIAHYLATGEELAEPTLHDRVETLLDHLRRNVTEHGEARGVREMRRQYGAYLHGVHGVAEVRRTLMRVDTLAGVTDVVRRFAGRHASMVAG